MHVQLILLLSAAPPYFSLFSCSLPEIPEAKQENKANNANKKLKSFISG